MERFFSKVRFCLYNDTILAYFFLFILIFVTGGLPEYLPAADSGRIIVGTWWIVVIVLATTYCGNLVAFLTFPKIAVPITTVDQLINYRGLISWGMQSGTFLEDYLKVNPKTKHVHKQQIKKLQ